MGLIFAKALAGGEGMQLAYTCPAGPPRMLGAIQVTNRAVSGDIKFCIAVAPGGAADSPEQHFIHDVTVEAATYKPPYPIGIVLNPGDVVRVEASGAATITGLG